MADDVLSKPYMNGLDETISSDESGFDSCFLSCSFIDNESDGNIEVSIKSVEESNESPSFTVKESLDSGETQRDIVGPIPRLNICMLVIGTRGDVQPFIAYGQALRAAGHRVRLATHEKFHEFVQEHGLEFFPLAGDPKNLMEYMVTNGCLLPKVWGLLSGSVARQHDMYNDIVKSTWQACTENDQETHAPFRADVIIANPPSYGHIHCAEALNIPLHIVFTMPWTATIDFAHPLLQINPNSQQIRRANYFTYCLAEKLTWLAMGDCVNRFRRNTLHLRELKTGQAIRALIEEKVPHTYCWSESFINKPADWPAHISISGFFFIDGNPQQLPSDHPLVKFLNSVGQPIIYIGFGSITLPDPDRLLKVVLRALHDTQYRAILHGLVDNNDKSLPETVFTLKRDESVDHRWLFEHVNAVCHHGGIGTTSAAIRAGKPSIIVSFFGDQFFWGNIVHSKKAGFHIPPKKRYDVQYWVEAINHVMKEKVSENAIKLQDYIRDEDGCYNGVQSFHRNLPLEILERMKSDLEPSYAACYHIRKYSLKVSRPVAEVLVITGLVSESDLSPLSTRKWTFSYSPDNRPSRFTESDYDERATYCQMHNNGISRLQNGRRQVYVGKSQLYGTNNVNQRIPAGWYDLDDSTCWMSKTVSTTDQTTGISSLDMASNVSGFSIEMCRQIRHDFAEITRRHEEANAMENNRN